MKEHIDALGKLEEKSRLLDCPPDEFRRWMRRLEVRGREFLGELPSGPAVYALGRAEDVSTGGESRAKEGDTHVPIHHDTGRAGPPRAHLVRG